ncbi:MAG: type II secretion system F family protein [Clostridiaceae bacterium]|nr:type II secretion system F family protein [Clostridiaceae bacterium]
MPVFSYKVKNAEGAILTGETKVDSRERLVQLMGENGFIPLEIVEKNFITDISQISIFRKKVKLVDLVQFCRQFSIMLEAGISIAGALDVIRNQSLNPTLKDCLNDMFTNIQKGTSLSTAMSDFPDIFPAILLSMVEAGEVSGQLDRVFTRMADQFEKDYKQKQKVKGAMTYPIIILIIAVIVVAVMVAVVIPQFGKAFAGMNVELPKLTQVMLKISDFCTKYWYILIVSVVLFVYIIKLMYDSKNGKLILDKLVLKLPLVADVIQSMMTARLCRTLATLLSSGVLMIESMEIVQRVLGNSILMQKMGNAIEELKKGQSLTRTINEMSYFPPMAISMIKTGEESGNLDDTLKKSASFFEDQLEEKIQKLTTFIEPLIMICLGGVVAFIILSVLYPMISVYQNIGADM